MDYQCGHSIGRHHEREGDGYPICPKCLHAERDKLRAALAKYRWIPVGERLPKEDGQYLVWTVDFCEGSETGGWWRKYRFKDGVWREMDMGTPCWKVTHWKEIILPETEK